MKFNIKKLLGLGDQEPQQEATSTDIPLQQPPKINAAADSGLPSAPQKRKEIIRFIIETLRPYIDEENSDIVGLRLYALGTTNEEAELLSVALYQNKPDEFKNKELALELANHYIRLPKNWAFTAEIVSDELPVCRFRQGTLGLDLVRTMQEVGGHRLATLVILEGQATQEQFTLDPDQKLTYLIGRGKKPVLKSGRIRTNDIAFLIDEDAGFDPVKGVANASVSRNHAKITYDVARQKFLLYAEEGGLPMSDNKTKILKTDDSIIRVYILGMGYELADGDQIELGGEVKMLIELKSTNL